MKNIKVVILTIAVIIIIITGLVFINYINTKQEKYENNELEEQIIQKSTIETKIVDNSAMYFTIKSCIDTYMKYLSEQNKMAIYRVLSSNYIKDNNIKEDNVLKYVETLEGKKIDFSIIEMRVKSENEKIQTYYIDGIIRNENNNNKKSKLTINIDIENKVFNIIPSVIRGIFDE